MQYTQTELANLLTQVEEQFSIHLAKAEDNFRLAKSEGAVSSVDGTETLAKAEDDSAEAKDKKEDKESEAPAAEAKDESKEESKEAPPAEAKEEAAAPEAPADEAAAPAADGHGYDEEDLAHLREMYASMSFEELMAHHDAVKECLDAQAAAQAPAQEAAPAPAMDQAAAPAAEAAPAPIDKCGDMSMGKSEDISVDLVKSELAAEKAKNEELSKQMAAVSEFITKLATKRAAPAAKAITSVETIAKSEVDTEVKPLSKAEITAILSKKAADPKLSKSDREAINSYYGAGQVGLEKINHLLK